MNNLFHKSEIATFDDVGLYLNIKTKRPSHNKNKIIK